MTKCKNNNCDEDGSLPCSRCKNKTYCSTECQNNDWKVHKTTCKTSIESTDDSQTHKSSSNVPTRPLENKCANVNCDEDGSLHCSRCKSKSYCSKECQKNDWKTHKTACKTSAKSTDDSQTHKSSSSVPTRPVINKCANVNCDKDGNLRCSRCKKTSYCSKECQNEDWKAHKTNCNISHPCATSSNRSSNDTQPRSTSESNNEAQEYQDFLYSMMGMMSNATSVADEYKRDFPYESAHIQRIKKAEFVYRTDSMIETQNLPLFSDADFDVPKFEERWGPCLVSNEKDDLLKFLSTETSKLGDIYLPKYYERQYQSQFFQTMRNTAITNQVYEFGRTYVGFGYVDLFQLIWGAYQNVEAGSLTFYGYEMCHVTYLRSKLIYHMLKFDEVSTNSILQVWFSSCWDSTTLEVFEKCVDDLLTHAVENLLSKGDLAVLKKWKYCKIDSSFAKQKFSEGLRNPDFDNVWSMREVKDRVKFSRYLLTGCIFVHETETACGNPTMLTNVNGQVKISGELFFNAIELKGIDSQKVTFLDNLFEIIEKLTCEKTETFRSLIKAEKILVHLNRSFVDPNNLEFASSIRSLQPYAIDWSNIADYLEKNSFIKFAKACSVDDTIHQMHFLNWVYYVFGSVYVDWRQCQSKLQDAYIIWRQQQKKRAEMVKQMGCGASLFDRYFIGERFTNRLNSINLMLSCRFKSHFEDFFLSDENGKPLNRYKSNLCDAAILPFFSQSPTMFRSIFTFNEDIDLMERHAQLFRMEDQFF